jgi:hypothetical protein
MWVYKIIEKETQEILYVGQTCRSLNCRFTCHKSNAQYGKTPFHMYIQTIGDDAIDILELDTASNIKELQKKEKEWIHKLDPPFNIACKLKKDTSGIHKWMREPEEVSG